MRTIVLINHWHSTESRYYHQYYYLHNRQHLYKHNSEALLHTCCFILQDNYTLRNDKFEDIILLLFDLRFTQGWKDRFIFIMFIAIVLTHPIS